MKKPILIVLGLVISALGLLAAVHQVDWRIFAAAVLEIDLNWILLAVVLMIVNFVFRAARWRLLLGSCAVKASFFESYRLYMIGYMANVIFPFKAGELIRPYLMGRKHQVSASAVFATVIVERLADVICLSSLLFLALFVGIMQIPLEIWQGAAIFLIGALSVSLALWVLTRYPELLRKTSDLVSFLPFELGQRIVGGGIRFLGGFRETVKGGIVLRLVLWTVGTWVLSFLTIRSYLLAFSLNLPWYAPAFILAVVNFGILLPSSPGAVGLAHFLYVYSLSLFHVDKAIALSFAVIVHGVGFALVLIWGLISAWQQGITLRDFKI